MRGLREVGRNSPLTEPEIIDRKTTYRCPYCGVQATLTILRRADEHCICQCDNPECDKIFYSKVKTTSEFIRHDGTPELSFKVLETYPKYVPQKHESIPPNIWSDYLEACRCFDAEAYKATVVMCRRMLQNVCLDRGAKKKKADGKWISLREQIKDAFPQKDYSLIHSIADGIKYFGDYGAHPQDDEIDKVKKDDSKELLDFTYTILQISYIDLWRIKQLTKIK